MVIFSQRLQPMLRIAGLDRDIARVQGAQAPFSKDHPLFMGRYTSFRWVQVGAL